MICSGIAGCSWRGRGAADARDYDAYLWLNDDTFLYEGTLTSLQRAVKDTEGKAIIVGATEDANHSKLTYGGRLREGGNPYSYW